MVRRRFSVICKTKYSLVYTTLELIRSSCNFLKVFYAPHHTLQVVAKGMIVLSRTITFKNMATSHTFGMLFTDSIALHISPQVRFVVSYITKKDEIIADSIALNVKDYFVNKVPAFLWFISCFRTLILFKLKFSFQPFYRMSQ